MSALERADDEARAAAAAHEGAPRQAGRQARRKCGGVRLPENLPRGLRPSTREYSIVPRQSSEDGQAQATATDAGGVRAAWPHIGSLSKEARAGNGKDRGAETGKHVRARGAAGPGEKGSSDAAVQEGCSVPETAERRRVGRSEQERNARTPDTIATRAGDPERTEAERTKAEHRREEENVADLRRVLAAVAPSPPVVFIHDNNGVPAVSKSSARGCVVCAHTRFNEQVIAALRDPRASLASLASSCLPSSASPPSPVAGANRRRPLSTGKVSKQQPPQHWASPLFQANTTGLEAILDSVLRPQTAASASTGVGRSDELARAWGGWRSVTIYVHLLRRAALSQHPDEPIIIFYTSSGEPIQAIGVSLLLAAHSEVHLIAATDRRPALRQPRRLALRHQISSASAVAFEYRESSVKCRVQEGAVVAVPPRRRSHALSLARTRGGGGGILRQPTCEGKDRHASRRTQVSRDQGEKQGKAGGQWC